MSLDPRLKKFLSFGLIAAGALTAMSGIVGLIGSWQLIDSAEAESLGVTRGEFIVTYAGFLLAGAVLIYFGWRGRK
ncbi:MAG: hypothetical protein EXS32_00700 [Opitutus sp.]|nr:hypothetical protein [Opitutus sp.]